jgi:OmpA-OmpF porin, OOP family
MNRSIVAVAVSFGIAAWPGTAAAQERDARGFALDRFAPSGGGSAWFTLESLDFRGNGRPAAGIFADWAFKPLVLYDADGREAGAIVERQGFVHLGVAINLFDRLRVGLSAPIALDQRGAPARTADGINYPGPNGTGIGDQRLSADLLLLGGDGGPLALALGAQVFAPTGKAPGYLTDDRWRVAPRLLVAGEVGLFSWAARAGVQFRRPGGVGFPEVGNQLEAGAALGVRPVPALLLGPEVTAATSLRSGQTFEPRATPVEVLFGAHVRVADDWHLGLGAAPGLTDGLGAPRLRLVARVEYFPALGGPGDRDGDGVSDADDACPDRRGRRTDNPATNGCPPRDRDGDNVLDDDDACPDEPGPYTIERSTRGCPIDADGDGIPDTTDACRDVPGIPSSDPRKHGCPGIVDRDGDGVADGDDACPDIPGKKTDNPRTNGCADRDSDGVFDPEDACPDQAGPADPTDRSKNGCPVARVEKGQIRIDEQVKFQTNRADILPESDRVLQAVAKIFQDNPQIKKVRVEGHTDNRGTAALNKRLSQRRAAAVVKWLVDHGVDASRLVSEGHGAARPIATNRTEEGRQENRRVEMHIIDPPKTPEGP